jgi:hypothetical protein
MSLFFDFILGEEPAEDDVCPPNVDKFDAVLEATLIGKMVWISSTIVFMGDMKFRPLT